MAETTDSNKQKREMVLIHPRVKQLIKAGAALSGRSQNDEIDDLALKGFKVAHPELAHLVEQHQAA